MSVAKAFPLLLFLVVLSAVIGCQQGDLFQEIKPSFFYWKTSLSLSEAEKSYLHQLNCRHLYVKIADIGLESGTDEIIPYSQLQVSAPFEMPGIELAGAVFITNEVFSKIDGAQSKWLADKIAGLFEQVKAKLPNHAPLELQIDCDWTGSTQKAYFQFLQELKTLLGDSICLSATIRLHQYKFPQKTGVPPVDRGMLMFYNTGDIEQTEEENSILSLRDARKYVEGAPQKYPLALDLALPVFGWSLVYRNGELWKILPGEPDSLPPGILERGTFVNGHYLRPGDLIRREQISPELLKDAARLAASIDLAADARLAFFQLDQLALRNYPAPLIKEVCHIADSIRARK
jgi:hypothetical protein